MSEEEYGSDDPTAIRSIAVTPDDVVTALEARLRGGRPVVIRVTPPYYGRMRARLHVAGGEGSYDDTPALHVDPRDLCSPVPHYPEVDETASAAEVEGTYDRDRHRDRHRAAVDAWREAARERIVGRLTLDTDAGPHEVTVKRLG